MTCGARNAAILDLALTPRIRAAYLDASASKSRRAFEKKRRAGARRRARTLATLAWVRTLNARMRSRYLARLRCLATATQTA